MITGTRDVAPSLIVTLLAIGCISTPSPVNLDGGPALPTCSTSGPPQVRQLAAGANHTCAVLTDGRVFCWGWGGWGKLGYGDTEHIGDTETPASRGAVDLGSACAVQVAAGAGHTCALLESGGVRCWGRGGSGQLGVTPIESVDTPPTVDIDFEGATAVQVTAGGSHTCVRLSDNGVRCFGGNDSGQLGVAGTSLAAALRTDVNIGGKAADITAGLNHTCVRLLDGSAKCWGQPADGRLGYNGTVPVVPSGGSPAVLTGGTATALTTGLEHTCAIVDETSARGVVRCWGLGDGGRLGNGNTQSVGDDEHPDTVTALSFDAPVSMISAGGYHTCALVEGKVWCWGFASSGQLGYSDSSANIGDTVEHPLRDEFLDTGLDSIMEVVAGLSHTCALSVTGRVRCWGSSADGTLGYGDNRQAGTFGDPIRGAGDVHVWCDTAPAMCD